MKDLFGFELVEERKIQEVNANARLYRYQRTGTELMSLTCPDENKVFGVSFRTPPRDSTGVAHILEHSVLCGSRKYPVKEPFVELLKTSLQTFLNAFTYPDKTCYPVASTNLQDFYNLIDVYLDAVFHPRITDSIFRQEGWHYELEDNDGPLLRKGVVFNEMKGAYSSPDSLLYEYVQQTLFPDTTYGLDSGGDPEVIPDLTYEGFKAFHGRFYHPSNARIWFYGDDPEEERLRLIDSCLSGYHAIEPDSEVGVQKAFTQPLHVDKAYAGGEDAKGMMTLSWLLPETLDRNRVLSLQVLEELLIGLPSSPLRRALTESGLGEDLAGVGLEDELRQMFFSTGLKGIDPKDADKVEGLILETLERFVTNGPTQEMVEAAVNTVEFSLRENNTGRFPRGLSLMLRSLTSWLYGGDPFAPVAFEQSLAGLKQRLEAGETLFQDLVRRYLLENPHRVSLRLSPDPSLGDAREADERAGLAARLEAMSDAERRRVVEEAEELARLQEEPDPPEALASIPRLALTDISPAERRIDSSAAEFGGVPARLHDIPSQGILYLDAGFDLRGVPERLLPLVPLFGRALFEMGTTHEDFATLSMRVARKTGGIEPETFTSGALNSTVPVARLFLRGKATAAQLGDMFDILRDVLLDARFDDRERFRQILLEEKARLEQHMIPAGHMVVLSRLRARTGLSGWAGEKMGGVDALLALRALVDEVENDWSAVLGRLEELRRCIVSRDKLMLNLTGSGDDLPAAEPLLSAFVESLPDETVSNADWQPGTYAPREGLTLPAQVNYVGKILNLDQSGYRFHGSHLAATKHARMAYLWEKVRVRGGAYGAFCTLDRFDGSLAFASYRDPNLTATLEAFDGTGAFFRELKLTADEISGTIIGAVGDVDTYLLPDAQGFTSLIRELTGDTQELRQAQRDELLSTNQADLNRFGELIESLVSGGDVVVLGSKEAMDASGMDLSIQKVL